MSLDSVSRRSLFEIALPWLVLAVLLIHSYAYFVVRPYAGFEFLATTHRVTTVYDPQTGLLPSDRLLKVGGLDMAAYAGAPQEKLLTTTMPGQHVPVWVARGEQKLAVDYIFPGPTSHEKMARLTHEWYLAYFFWLAGTATLLFMRPKDARWGLLIAFDFLTAWLLGSGFGLASWHVGVSNSEFLALSWLVLPVYWHLHWVFPQPPRRLHWLAWAGLYAVCLVMAAAHWLQLLWAIDYPVPLVLAMAGSLAMLALRSRSSQPNHRVARLLLLLAGVAFLPFISVLSLAAAGIGGVFTPAAVLPLPLLPFAYLSAAYQRRLIGQQLRVNRLFVSYIYFAGLISILIGLTTVLTRWVDEPGEILVTTILVSLVTALVSILAFHRFQRLLERRWLGIQLPSGRRLEHLMTRVTTSLDHKALVDAISLEVLPSLLVRRSALCRVHTAGQSQVLYLQGVLASHLPTPAELPDLLSEAGRYRALNSAGPVCPWVRLVLPLKANQVLLGYWLLGSRDPDDLYSPGEIELIQSVAQQVSNALINISQSDLLHLLYQQDVDQGEVERARLARELHDGPMNELGALLQRLEPDALPAGFLEGYQAVLDDLRQTISDLRPLMLSYGLYPAPQALADGLRDRLGSDQNLVLEVAASGERFDDQVELHAYRIVQQACENALRHARPRQIRVSGRRAPALVELTVTDDGQGFAADGPGDLRDMLDQRRYGLAGGFERAALIGASLAVHSAPGEGTRVELRWPAAARRVLVVVQGEKPFHSIFFDQQLGSVKLLAGQMPTFVHRPHFYYAFRPKHATTRVQPI